MNGCRRIGIRGWGLGPIAVTKDGGWDRTVIVPEGRSEWRAYLEHLDAERIPWVGDRPTEAKLVAAEARCGERLADPGDILFPLPDGGCLLMELVETDLDYVTDAEDCDLELEENGILPPVAALAKRNRWSYS